MSLPVLAEEAKAAYADGVNERVFDILYKILSVVTGKEFISIRDVGNA